MSEQNTTQLIEMKNEDFKDVMYEIEGDFVIVTDPPYNIGYKYNEYKDKLSDKEYIEMIAEFKGHKLAIIHYPEETMKYFVPALGVPDEVNMWCYNSNLPNKHSRLINYYNMKPDYTKVRQPFKDPKDPRNIARMKKGQNGARSYDWFTDIQLVKNKNLSKKKYPHPCPMPVELMERIIKLTTEEGDLIFDPFAGSGSTAIACMNTNRRFIGAEIDTLYFDMANERIAEHGLKLEKEKLEKQIELF